MLSSASVFGICAKIAVNTQPLVRGLTDHPEAAGNSDRSSRDITINPGRSDHGLDFMLDERCRRILMPGNAGCAAPQLQW